MGRGDAALGVTRAEKMRADEKKYGRRDERSDAEKHCQPLACELQRCASRHTYAPQKCNGLLTQYRQCIDEFLRDSKEAK